MNELNWFSPLQALAAATPSELLTLLLPSLLIVANVLGVGMILPQAIRLRTHRCTAGVSGAWIGVGLTLNLWWLAYATQARLWGLIPVSAGAFVLYAVIAVQLLRIERRAALPQLLFGLFVLGGAPLPFLLLDGWSGAGVAIGLSYGVQFLPAAVAAYRSASVAGVSSATWVMAWIEAAVWLLYGIDSTDGALLLSGTGGLLVSSIILVLLATKPGDLPVPVPPTDRPAISWPANDSSASRAGRRASSASVHGAARQAPSPLVQAGADDLR